MYNEELARDVKEFIPELLQELNKHFNTNATVKLGCGKSFNVGMFELADGTNIELTIFSTYKKVGGRKKRSYKYYVRGHKLYTEKHIVKKNLVHHIILDLELYTSAAGNRILTNDDKAVRDIIQ